MKVKELKQDKKYGYISAEGDSYETDLGAHIHLEVLKNGEYINPSEIGIDS